MNTSKQALIDTFGEDAGTALDGLLNGSTDPESFESVEKWVRQCYHRPSDDELLMEAANEVLGGFGVEAIRGRYVDSYHFDIQASYVNMGDTYVATLLLDHETDEYEVCSWGGWVEELGDEREVA